MKAMKRNLKYWGYSVEMLLLPAAGVVALLSLVEYADGGSVAALSYLLSYLPLIGIIMMAVLGFVGVGTYFPFAMSMGSTRKANFAAMQIMEHMMALQVVLVTFIIHTVYMLISAAENAIYYTPAGYLFLLFFNCCICNILGTLSFKFGRTAALIGYILMIVACGAGVGVASALQVDGLGSLSVSVQFICFAAAFLLDMLMILLNFLAIKKYEVRA